MVAFTRSHNGSADSFAGRLGIFVLALVVCVTVNAQSNPDWPHSLTATPANPFPNVRPFTATFRFGWTNMMDAAEAEVQFQHIGTNGYHLQAKGKTVGLVRPLWKMDVTHDASGTFTGCFPTEMMQAEKYAAKSVKMHALFQRDLTWSLREVKPSPDAHKWRKISLPNLRDLTAAMLFVRSQPLKVGDNVAFTSFPGDSAYLVKIRVVKSETLRFKGENKNVLRLELGIQKVELKGPNKGKLVPHSKFHEGTIWLSDDADRIPLRAEVDVFIGYVYGQLEKITFDEAR